VLIKLAANGHAFVLLGK